MERKYWKQISYISPVYGADVNGTLFGEEIETWNVCKLDTILGKCYLTVVISEFQKTIVFQSHFPENSGFLVFSNIFFCFFLEIVF